MLLWLHQTLLQDCFGSWNSQWRIQTLLHTIIFRIRNYYDFITIKLPRTKGCKKKKRKYKQRFDVKVRWLKQQKKQSEEIYKERTDVSYGPGIAVITELGKESRKRKKGSADSDNIQKFRCGSTQHSWTSHHECPLNKTNQPIAAAEPPVNIQETPIHQGNTSNAKLHSYQVLCAAWITLHQQHRTPNLDPTSFFVWPELDFFNSTKCQTLILLTSLCSLNYT